MATQWQHPYMAQGAIADYQRDYMNTLASAYTPGNSMSACGRQPCTGNPMLNAPCGYNGIVSNCPKNSMMDWWITGHQNSIYAVNGGSLWPWLEQPTSACGANLSYGSCYEYAPKLLGCCATLTGPNQGNMTLPGLGTAQSGAGYSIGTAYGFNAEAAASANLGIGNYSRMQKSIPPRQLREPCAGNFIR